MERFNYRIPLWRCFPPNAEGKTDNRLIFPSARQAISKILSHWCLERSSRVAYPEWSSHCLVSALGKICSPIPCSESIKYHLPVNAFLLYEQWGWPFKDAMVQQIRAIFPKAKIIFDMVDSAHFDPDSIRKDATAVISLSKILGLPAGGIVFNKGEFLAFQPKPEHQSILADLERHELLGGSAGAPIMHASKHHFAALDSITRAWLDQNDVFAAIRSEGENRRKNLRILLNDPITLNWPAWMREAVENGARPGIAPLYKDGEDSLLLDRQERLKKTGIESAIYHFNWSGDIFAPQYAKCLVVPVHGLVNRMQQLLEVLERGYIT